ncbi:hypothetical protein PDR5_13530 [Pseudomonas sp. DR 5-09]|nr:hypothetical protein PDR5_13530 [Pseudomonas sp. DR 5-09]
MIGYRFGRCGGSGNGHGKKRPRTGKSGMDASLGGMGVGDTLLFTERLLKAALTPTLSRREREPTELFS